MVLSFTWPCELILPMPKAEVPAKRDAVLLTVALARQPGATITTSRTMVEPYSTSELYSLQIMRDRAACFTLSAFRPTSLIGPGRFGYGIAAAGCKDFTVLGNRISDGTHFVGSMDMIPEVTPPTPFLRINDGWAEGTFQSDFIEGPVRYLIGVRDGLGHGMQYRSDSLQWSAGSEAALEKVRVELIEEGELVVWDQQQPGRVLWSSSSGHVRRRGNVSPMLQLDRLSGQLSIKRAQTGQVLWDPMDYLAKIGYRAFYKDPVLVLVDQPPYLQVKDGGSTLFASSSAWKHFALNAGSFVAVVADDGSATALDASAPAVPHDSWPTSMTEALSHLHLQSRAPPPLPRRGGLSGQRPASNTYLWLDPHTSRLVLHMSDHPEQPQDGQIAWVSPNWKQCASQPTEPSKAILQEYVPSDVLQAERRLIELLRVGRCERQRRQLRHLRIRQRCRLG